MTTNLPATIRRELELAWQNGYNAGTSGALPTKEQVVESGTEQVLKAIQNDAGNDMTLAYMVGRKRERRDAQEAKALGL